MSHIQSPRPSILRFLATEDGKDASLRFIQYFLRFFLYLRRKELRKDYRRLLFSTVALLSAFRRLFALARLLATFIKYARPDNLSTLFNSRLVTMQVTNPHPTVMLLAREILENIATLADNVFLFYRVNLFPLPESKGEKANQVADLAGFISATLGLVQVARSRNQILKEGRQTRRQIVEMEDRAKLLLLSGDEDTDVEARKSRLNEEQELRETIRANRRQIRGLRDELSDLWYEKLRLSSDAVFTLYDFLQVQLGAESVLTWSGLVSSSIQLAQSWGDYSKTCFKL